MNTDSQRLSKLRSLLEAEPNDGFLLYGAAQELHKLGRFDEALRSWEEAIRLNDGQKTKSPWPPLNLGLMLTRLDGKCTARTFNPKNATLAVWSPSTLQTRG